MLRTLWSRLSLPFFALLGALTLSGCAGPNLMQRARGPFGLLGLVILILDILAIVEVARGNKSTGGKLLWILLIVFFPVGGLILYWIFGR
jgi:hypothetical protein